MSWGVLQIYASVKDHKETMNNMLKEASIHIIMFLLNCPILCNSPSMAKMLLLIHFIDWPTFKWLSSHLVVALFLHQTKTLSKALVFLIVLYVSSYR